MAPSPSPALPPSPRSISPREAWTIIETSKKSPEYFAREVLGHDPWETPARIMAAIAKPRARVAVKACHSSAKTYTAGEITLWWTASGGITVTTAPTFTQVKRLLWGEIIAAYGGSRYPLGGKMHLTEWQIGPQQYAMGLSTNEGVNFQGFHGKVLIIEDEAPGIEADIMAAIEGIRAGGDVRVLMLGNPVIASGPFYDAFTLPTSGWDCYTIDAFDTPNLIGLTVADIAAIAQDDTDNPFFAHNPRPYLTTRRWVHEKYYEWGEDSPEWQSRVRGEFPDESEDQLISRRWAQDARLRVLPAPERTAGVQPEYTAGLDVAGPGEDATVLTVREGPRIVEQLAWNKPDPRGEVVAALMPWRGAGTLTVNVDTVGIGYGIALHLQDNGYRVNFVNVGNSPADSEKYRNAKAEYYWGLRQRFRDGDVAGLSEATARELLSIRYAHNARGQIEIESKEHARKRGVKSPDHAESLMLAFAHVQQEVTYAPSLYE